MPALAAPPAPYTREYKDTSITVWWQAETLPTGCVSLVLETREFPKPAWARTALAPGATQHVATGLFPNATFEFRLRGVAADGSESEPGPAAAADTLAAGCVPKDEPGAKKKPGCVLA